MSSDKLKEQRISNLKSWQKGVSGNPKGRPKGTGKLQKVVEAKIQEAVQLQIGDKAKKLLQANALGITSEIITIALRKETTQTPSHAKVKCLLACFERIVPALKVVEVKDMGDNKRPSDMDDAEIIGLMERMVNIAQAGQPDALPTGELDG